MACKKGETYLLRFPMSFTIALFPSVHHPSSVYTVATADVAFTQGQPDVSR
jgi:hypothetical protein